MHNTGGDIIRLSGCESFPFSVLLARDNGPLDHRPVFVARMRMAASADARWPLGRYKRKDFAAMPVTGASETSMLTLTCCASADADPRNKNVAHTVTKRRIIASQSLH